LSSEPLEEARSGVRRVIGGVTDFVEPIIERIAMPRRIADGIRRIMTMVPRILQGKVGRFARTDLFLPALDVAEIVLRSREQSTHAIETLRRDTVPPPPGRDS